MAEETHTPGSDDTGYWFDRDTLLDITVNLIPMGILLFFVVLFTMFQPWDWNPFMFGLMHFLTVFPFLLLAILTYVSGKVISRDERRLEETTGESDPPSQASTADGASLSET